MIEGLAVVVMSTDARGASNAKAKREALGATPSELAPRLPATY